MKLLALVLSLPTENATVRQRVWRSLKGCGAAVLRDGVYLMPDREECLATLSGLATDVREAGGSANVLRIDDSHALNVVELFDRKEDYALLLNEVTQVRDTLTAEGIQDALKRVRKLRKTFTHLIAIDFFPGEAQRQLDQSIQELELACARVMAPDEPHAMDSVITSLQSSDYQGRTWATRQRPWVDRLASAWLIHRFIDPQAKLLWLASPEDCPTDALGYDFDGATFSHIGNRVTFEVLAASFNLEQPAIKRLGMLVHYLDVGGVAPPEASGVESVLAGLRETLKDDDHLLAAACAIFDGLLVSFVKGVSAT